MKRPNILIFTCHDLGDYLGCYGTPVKTPNIDALAQSGVRFENHFSTGTICSPARGSITTGCYPHTNGLMGLIHRGWNLNCNACPPMAKLMAQNGMETHLFGFQHEHMFPEKLGYQFVHQGKDDKQHCDKVVPMFQQWLAERKSDKPFYAAIGVTEVHRMGMNPSHFRYPGYPVYNPEDVQIRPYLPDIEATRNDLAEFYGAISFMDEWFGRVMQALEEAGERENTLVIFATDHGASFMHSKATLYEGGVKTALIMSFAGRLPAGKVLSGLSSHVDVLPTVFSLLEMDVPEHVQGVSQLPAICAETASVRDYAFSEENYNNHFVPGRAVRSARFRYIRNGLRINVFDFLIPEVELSTSDFRKNLDVFNFYSAKREFEELYDLQKDPGERVNVAQDAQYQDVLRQMQDALARHLVQTQDPFAQFSNGLLMPEQDYETLRGKRNSSQK